MGTANRRNRLYYTAIRPPSTGTQGLINTPEAVVMLICRLNPGRMGVPKRPASMKQQVDTFVKEHGGDRPIYRCVHMLLRKGCPAPGMCTTAAAASAPNTILATSTSTPSFCNTRKCQPWSH